MKNIKILICIAFIIPILGCENIQKQIDIKINEQIQKVDTLVNKQIDTQLNKMDTLINNKIK